ncbi:hypothetical protein GmHk_14G041689 [Glycine max]|nr:hypothetical protein GmHk_14G041689 [Glycine max]
MNAIGVSLSKNRLEHKRLYNLVYVKYNQELAKRYNYRDEIDPISLNDIDECNEWLVGKMDGDDENEDVLPWDPITCSGQRTKKRKEPFGVEDVAPNTKIGQVKGSSSLRGKEQMIEVEDNAILEEFEKEFQGIDFGNSKEKVEGHAPLLDHEEYDYIGKV